MALEMDAKRKRIETYVKYGLTILGAAAVAPIALLAVEGIMGIALAAFLIFVIWNFAPVAATYLANKRIQALIAVVEANPIETMQNLWQEKSAELNAADNNIADFETEIRNFDDQISDFTKAYPDEAVTYQELSDKMKDALKDMKTGQTAARKELNSFEQQINKAKAIYRMSLAAQKVVRLSKSAEAQVFARIKEQVAFDTVRTQLNRAFSNLNLALERRQDARNLAFPAASDTKALPPGGVTPADVPAVREKVAVGSRR